MTRNESGVVIPVPQQQQKAQQACNTNPAFLGTPHFKHVVLKNSCRGTSNQPQSDLELRPQRGLGSKEGANKASWQAGCS